MNTSPAPLSDPDADTAVHAHGSALANLAFGSLSRTGIAGAVQGRNLAFLPNEALELDLSDPAQRQFGDYELLELIGEGGMGVVYRARQSSLDRDVAVKLLAAGPWASREFVERFRREAQNAARMQHPNIVAIYEVGSAEELHFFSMRLVHGGTLASCLKRDGKLPAQQAAALLRTIAEAVDYAHRLGVLHLDLKPANVLLDESEHPHVADFGLARRLDNALATDNDEVSGTPSYMAPEQAQVRSQKITPATDIWGLGAILYELVTGTPPFLGASPQATLKLVVEGALLSPRHHAPDIPHDLEAIILKCMARNTAERYPSARALADDLGRFIEHRAVQARPLNAAQRVARWAKRQPYVATFAALFTISLLAGIVGVTNQWRRAEGNALLARTTLWQSRSAESQRLIGDGDAFHALAGAAANLREMEANGARDQASLERLRIGTVLANAPQLFDVIALNAAIESISIAPDGKSVAVGTDRIVHLIDVETGKERWQVDTRDKSFGIVRGDTHDNNSSLESLKFSMDGHRLIAHPASGDSIFYQRHIDTVLIDVDTGRVVDPPTEFADFLATDYAQDGRYALLFDKHGRVQRWRTMPWSPAGDLVAITGQSGELINPQGMMEAQLSANGDMLVAVYDDSQEFRSLDPVHLTTRHVLRIDPHGYPTSWQFNRDGSTMAIGTLRGNIALWDIAAGTARWLQPAMASRVEWLAFNPDGTRLLAGGLELRVFDPRSGELAALPVASGQGYISRGGFSSDGRHFWTWSWYAGGKFWGLPDVPGFPLQAPITSAPAMHGRRVGLTVAADSQSRLIATYDNGLVKLWRLPDSSTFDVNTAPMPGDTLRVDGRHLVRVDGNHVAVFDAMSDTTLGTPIALPQAPTFAGLSADGLSLIAIAGREVSAWDWQTGKALWPAVSLPNSPLRLSLAAKSPVLAVATGENDIKGFRERVHLFDLTSGKQRSKSFTVPGPLASLRLSADGGRLILWSDGSGVNAEANVLNVINTATSEVALRLVHEGKQMPIVDARFADDGSLWTSAGRENATGIWHWDADGKLLTHTTTRVSASDALVAETIWPLPQSKGVIALAASPGLKPLRVAADGTSHPMLGPDSMSGTNVAAINPDGNLLAAASAHGVSLINIASNEVLLPELELPLSAQELVQQLVFSPDGSRLTGRTTGGRWFSWRLIADMRAVSDIEQHLRQINPVVRSAGTEPALADDLRRALRAGDPGPAPAPNALGATPATRASTETPQTPTDAHFLPLDLSPIANSEPRATTGHVFVDFATSFQSLPRGIQRYDGVDFRLGRSVQLSGATSHSSDNAFPAQTDRLAIAPAHIAAVDVLVLDYHTTADEVGSVHLHFADGPDQNLPIMAVRDVWPHWFPDPKDPGRRRVGWLGSMADVLVVTEDTVALGESTLSRSYVVHLENPQPERMLTAISFNAPPHAIPGLLFLGVTLEPRDVLH